jgi:hypothetical protein
MGAGNLARDMYTLKKELGEEEDWDDEEDETLSDAVGYAVQAHHCISCSVIAEPKYKTLAKWAIDSDYDINRGNNGIALPAYFGHMRVENKQRHRGGHDQIYYNKVREELDALLEDLDGVDPCKNEKDRKSVLAALTGAENRIKAGLKGRSIWLYDWSQKLWSKDYRDEGSTNMASGRRREGSKAAGLQWVENFGSREVKRRHAVGKDAKGRDKKVLLAKWYSAYAYPVPGGLT